MYISFPMLVLIVILIIMFIPPIREVVKGTMQGLGWTTQAMNNSMKVGAISIIHANNKQLVLIERERATMPKVRSPDEILAEMLKESLPPQ